MGRTTDWHPVADADPAPGDTDAIRGEVVKLTRVADTILDQVAALRRVASAEKDGRLKGQYLGTIGAKAGDLAEHLNKAEGRYRTASSELKQWLTALEQAQQDTLKQLHNAQTAQQQIDTLNAAAAATPTSPPAHGAPSSGADNSPTQPPLTPDQQRSLADAHAIVDAARREVARIKADLDAEAALRERNIKAACQHDGLKDSRWDRMKATVNHFARAISDACNGLGWLATGFAIAALFFPGAGWLALAAMGATALSLGGHSALAAAGSGSWFDVGVDVVGLASFGVGRVVGKGLDSAVEGLQSTLKGGAAVRASTKAMDFAKKTGGINEMESLMKADSGVSEAEKAFTQLKLNDLYDAAQPAARAAAKGMSDLADLDTEFDGAVRPSWEVALEGDHKAAAIRAWTRNATDVAGDDPDVARGVATVGRQLNKAQSAYGIASAVDLGDKTYGSVYPYLNVHEGVTYNRYTRPPFTHEIGSSW